jgi:2-polyprenyl-3-methyl-5-hydroxy-6-metoxy-1,4-benzoquinol methylase
MKSHIPYYSCRECLFVFSSTDSNANLENKIADFETSYLQYFDEKNSDQKNHSKMLAWINKTSGVGNRTLLDIGCGSGKFVNFLNSTGEISAMGIEPSLSLFEHFLSGNNSFIHGTIRDFVKKNPGKMFDVISAFDVLEHTKDPIGFLKEISSLMHTSSYLFLSLPDAGSLHRKLAGKRWHYFNKYHFSYFSKNTLRFAAGQAGLMLISSSHQSRFFQTRYVWDYFKNFVLGKKSSYSSSKNGIIIPLNLFDNMYCVLKKDVGSI